MDDKHEEAVLLVSCLGDDDTGGGLFSYDGDRVERIDRLSTTGISLAGDRLVRVLWSRGAGPGETLIYDSRGVQKYLRVDELWEPHDIVWDGDHFIAVSPMQNSVLWISPSGEIVQRWRAPGDEDAWHLNCLLIRDGQLLVCAFGRFLRHREWVQDMKRTTGIVFDPSTGENVLEGLSQPHHPRFLDGAWVICNSITGELVRIDALTKTVMDRLALRGYTRGIGVSDELLFVGESAHRHLGPRPDSTAQIAIVCRRTWRLLDRLNLPCREVYDLVVVPRSVADGARCGFRTNPQRAAERDQYAMFDAVGVEPARLWATGDPLSPDACSVRIEAVLPQKLPRDSVVEVECTVENLGRAILVSAPPNPVHISYKWFCNDKRGHLEEIEGLRTMLPYALPPKHSLLSRLKIRTPPTAGQFALHITLVQEQVAWFDDLSNANCLAQMVEVD